MLRRIVLAVALGLAVLGGVATPAQAAGWTTLHRWPAGSVFLACKYTESGPSGPVWQVRLVLAHHPDASSSAPPCPPDRPAYDFLRFVPAHGHDIAGHRQRRAVGREDRDWISDRCQVRRYLVRRYIRSWGIGDENGGLGDADNHRFSQISNC